MKLRVSLAETPSFTQRNFLKLRISLIFLFPQAFPMRLLGTKNIRFFSILVIDSPKKVIDNPEKVIDKST